MSLPPPNPSGRPRVSAPPRPAEAWRPASNPGRGALFFADELGDADLEYGEARLTRFTNRLLFRSSELDFERGVGTWQSVPFESYDTELLPGLAALSFTFICANLDPELGPAEVWVLNAASPDYEIDLTTFDARHLYRFRIPKRLQQGAWPRVSGADRYNLEHEPTYRRRGDPPGFEIP